MDSFRYFEYGHLPEHLQEIPKKFKELIESLRSVTYTDEDQFKMGVLLLIQAKDCFVRSIL